MTVHYTYFCEVCGLGSPSDWERRACERDCIAKLRAERDAYRKAKAENDERFQREAFDARQERDEQRRIKDEAFDRLAQVIRERDEARHALEVAQACIRFFVYGAQQDGYEPSYLARPGWTGLNEIYDALPAPEAGPQEDRNP